MVDSNLSIPIGFRFHPTKKEILISYLRPAIKREPLPANVLMEIDIYGDKKQPWNLFDKDSSNTYWIFTMLKKKSGSRRIDRVAGCGCWLNQSYKEIKNSGGKLLGFDKSFTFTCKNKCCGRANINGNWIMNEYSLADKGLSEYVICEIKNKDAVDKKRKGGHADIDDDDGGMPITKKVCVDHVLDASSTYQMNYYEQNNHDFGELGHQENNNLIFMDRTQSQTMVINSCSPQGDGRPEFNNGSVCLALNDINEAMNLEGSADACDWKDFSSELEDLLSVPDTNMNNHNFGGFGHQGNNNPIFMDRTQSQINSCCPQGDGDEAFGQPEFTNGSVSFTVNDNIEAINLEASADACDWNKFFYELEDFSDLEELLNECT
ncbi:No apical meristem (NAM) protein [Corchorus olitorius]|uniref:No apical meristem (NAM) protein n=1 Tax=Corchorus olitorius TaxID=93759 RepID=A0A1R3GVV6_9ROSI|nr:No apical meristem (NAM) protein [Corchorus olitorius]